MLNSRGFLALGSSAPLSFKRASHLAASRILDFSSTLTIGHQQRRSLSSRFINHQKLGVFRLFSNSSESSAIMKEKEYITQELKQTMQEIETGKTRIFELEKQLQEHKARSNSGIELENIETELKELSRSLENKSIKVQTLSLLDSKIEALQGIHTLGSTARQIEETLLYKYEMKKRLDKKEHQDEIRRITSEYQRKYTLQGVLGGAILSSLGAYMMKNRRNKKTKKEANLFEEQTPAISEESTQEKAVFTEFKKLQDQGARDLMGKALLSVKGEDGGIDPLLLKRAKKVLCNTTWNISGALLDYARNMEKFETQNGYIYFHGEPGIGKSSLFAALVCHLNDPLTVQEFKRLFPFFKPYKNFIYIDGSSRKLKRMKEKDLLLVLNTLINQDYIVVLDQVLELMDNENTLLFLEQLKDQCKNLILLSHLPPPKKTQLFKNILHQKQLVELPLSEAVEQTTMTMKKFTFGTFTPHNIRQFFAYKIWFYIGGNMRKLSQIFFQDLILFENYLKSAGDVGRNEANREILDGKHKGLRVRETLGQLVSDLHEGKGVAFEYIWSLKFGSSQGRKFRIAESEIENFVKANILATRNFSHQQEGYKMLITDIMGFHSRRVQYALSHELLHNYPEYWKNREKERAKLQRYLQRVELKHILDYELYKVKKAMKQEEIMQWVNQLDHVQPTSQEEEQLAELMMKTNELTQLKKLTDAEINLVMLYFEAVQLAVFEQGYMADSFNRDFLVLDELKKGHYYFFNKYNKQIEGGIQKEESLARRIQQCKKLVEQYKTVPVLVQREEIFTQEIQKYKEDLKQLVWDSNLYHGMKVELIRMMDEQGYRETITMFIQEMRSKEEQSFRLGVELLEHSEYKLKQVQGEINAIPGGPEEAQKYKTNKAQERKKRAEERKPKEKKEEEKIQKLKESAKQTSSTSQVPQVQNDKKVEKKK